MAHADDGHSEAVAPAARSGAAASTAGPAVLPEQHLTTSALAAPTQPPPPKPPARRWRRWLQLGVLVVGLGVGGYFLAPSVITMLTTVSTDDAYVNSYATFVAPRVAGQVTKVWVEDNQRVKKGALLVQLDKEPYQVQVNIKKAAVRVAETNLTAAQAQVRGQIAQARANRFKLEHAIEDVNTQVANLRAAVATLKSRQATLELAKANLKRGEELAPSGGISKEDLDQRRQQVKVAAAAVDQAREAVYAIRAGLGLPADPGKGHDLTEVPPDLDQDFSTVRQALADLLQSAVQFGYFPTTWDATPKQAIADFYMQEALPLLSASSVGLLATRLGQGPILAASTLVPGRIKLEPSANLDRIYEHLIPRAPVIQQGEARLLQARRDLADADLNLRYTDVFSEIDGVVTRRNVNPGNNVQVGQALMAVRALRPPDLWIDANFKETQLADLRIGQRVRLEVDMYGSRREFEGRISGFTMGTGQTLALLPPQNATGNFVKIVQRLPVRIEVLHYDPDEAPLFVGTSVVPYVYYKEPATGPNAGKFLQPFAPLPEVSIPENPEQLAPPPGPTAPATRPQP